MKQNFIINADDFGISLGVNQAIMMAHQKGSLNSASLLINTAYTSDAVQKLSSLPSLQVGLHLNLTHLKAISAPETIPLLVDSSGQFKNGFLSLFLLSLIKPKELQKQISIEAESQIQKALSLNIALSHLDSHRHVHMIPVIFQTLKKLTQKYNIHRIRSINESLVHTFLTTKNINWIFDGGIIKYLLLKLFCFWNRHQSDVYFYSILYTGKIFKNRVKNLSIPKNFSSLEIMVHPNIEGIDQKNDENIFDKDVFSKNRLLEMEMLMGGVSQKTSSLSG